MSTRQRLIKQQTNSRLKNQTDLKDRLRKKIAVKQGPKKICLTMIVKNESKNMNRLLNSVKDIIDMISIDDTGSTDNTKEVITAWGKANNIPTTIHDEPFINFSFNRTNSVRNAKKTYSNADFFLLSDADFVWEINKGGIFDKTLLVDHKYLVDQYNRALNYWNIRLLSSKVDWECYGVTHEYWGEAGKQSDYSGEVRTSKITTIAIDDREDGGCKTDKFERDERLLRAGLNDPNESKSLKTRYKFYLAQTLKDTGRFSESIEFYNKRIQDGGWYEEVYYSKFQIGFNYEQLGWKKKQAVNLYGKQEKTPEDIEFLSKWNPNNNDPGTLMEESTKHFTDAGVNYLAAHKFRKVRSESLYYLTRMYRSLGLNEQALNIALIGNKIKYPETDTLFIERNCYDYLFDFEISIVAFYVPNQKDVGRKAVSNLIDRTDLPPDILNVIHQNSRHYI